MTTKAIEKLMLTIGVTDNTKKGISSISASVDKMKSSASGGFSAITGGAMGLIGAGLAIKSFMGPVYEMQDALADVSSLGVTEKGLKHLQSQALKFSTQYGESASDFVKSSYSIQSAIAGLTSSELATFTTASNVLAKATKADAATMTDFMGTMYGIFENQATQMGKAQWVQMIAGQTSEAIKIFKTSGTEMSSAFTSLGADAQSAGINLSEQMAVLGMLQATMSGSQAGTQYKAFLRGVGKAQGELGLSFTDSQGRMLPMLDILQKIKGKFGDTLSVKQADTLKTAFGSAEASGMLKLLLGQTEGLSKNINHLGSVSGMKGTEEMAKTMVNPWKKFGAQVDAVRIGIGTALLPTINDFLGRMSGGLKVITGWTQQFPNLTKLIGFTVIGVLALGAAVSAMSIIFGFGKLVMAAWFAGALLVKGVVLALNIAFGIFTAVKTAFAASTMLAAAAGFIAKMVFGAFLIVALLVTTAVSALGAAFVFLASTTGLIILGIIAVVVAVGLLIYYWSDLVEWFSNTTIGAGVINAFKGIGAGIESLLGKIKGLYSFIANNSISDIFSAAFGKILEIFPKLKSALSWLGIKVGVDDSTEGAQIAEIAGARTADTSIPSASQSLAEAQAEAGVGGTQFGSVTINSQSPMRPSDMEAWSALQGG